MKYYIKNYKESKNKGAYIPSSLMDLSDAIGLYLELREEFIELHREHPVLCNENGEEIDSIIDEIYGEKVCEDAFLVRIEAIRRESGEVIVDYLTNGNCICANEASAILMAINMFNSVASSDLALVKLELVP